MINWIISSSVLIAVLIGLRYFLRGKISLRLQYTLWGLVLLRLLIPFSLGSSRLSVMNTAGKVPIVQDLERVRGVGSIWQTEDGGVEGFPSNAYMPDAPITVSEFETDGTFVRMERAISLRGLFLSVWLWGAAIFFLVFAWSNLSFAIRLRRTRRSLEVREAALAVYVTEGTQTPCLFGLFRPAIYVTPEAAGDATVLRHTVAHETTHFRHGDHLWALLRGVCLSLHWYNPLVWRAALLSRDDGELACDEGTVRRLGEGERAEYGRTLIAMTCRKRADILIAATTMTGGNKSIKERIALLAARPKTALVPLVAVALIAAAAVVLTFTGANRNGEIPIEVDAQINAPEAVVAYAKDNVRRMVNYYTELGEDAQTYRITRARISGLTRVNSETGDLSDRLYLYRLEYRLLPDYPEHVALVGGMSIEDGWITEWGSVGQPYLLLLRDDSGPQPVWQLIGNTNTDGINVNYGSDIILDQYGDLYTAAAAEMYHYYLKGTPPSRLNRLDVISAMREVEAGDIIPVFLGNSTADQLARALNAAADHQINGKQAAQAGYMDGIYPYWSLESVYLEGGPDSFSDDDLHFSLSCGLTENLVEVALTKGNRRDAAYFKDEALYQLVRHSADYEEVIDREAYDQFRDILDPEMQKTYEMMSLTPGGYTGYQLTRFNLAWQHEDPSDGSTVDLYDFVYALLVEDPTQVGWAGGMYLDSQLRVQGVFDGLGQLVVKYSGDEVVGIGFMDSDFRYSFDRPWNGEYNEEWALEQIDDRLAQPNPLARRS